jgi:hypothetical protein
MHIFIDCRKTICNLQIHSRHAVTNQAAAGRIHSNAEVAAMVVVLLLLILPVMGWLEG